MNQTDVVQLVQMVSAGAGAFLGGLALVWRVRSIIPALFRQVRPALVQLISEAVRGTVREELAEPKRHLQALTFRVDRLERFEPGPPRANVVEASKP